MSSCDDALADFNQATFRVNSARSAAILFGLAAGISTAIAVAALIGFVWALVATASPGAPVAAAVSAALGSIAIVSGLAALLMTAAFAFAVIMLIKALYDQDQAYAAVLNKCQNEPDRIPTYT